MRQIGTTHCSSQRRKAVCARPDRMPRPDRQRRAPVIGRCFDSMKPFIEGLGSSSTRAPPRHARVAAETTAPELALLSVTVSALHRQARLALPAGHRRPVLGADGYHLNVKYAGIGYARCTLVTSRLAWRWEGVVYEFLACDAPLELATLIGPSSSWRMMEPAAATGHLERDTRDLLLAQSYRDAGELAKSRRYLLRRAAMRGREAETSFAQYQAAILVGHYGIAEELVRRGIRPARRSWSRPTTPRPSRLAPSSPRHSAADAPGAHRSFER
jgi:hypothetical protein